MEKLSGNDNSPESLKTRLAHALDEKNSSEELSQMVQGKKIDIDQINMTSVVAFKMRLNEVMQRIIS